VPQLTLVVANSPVVQMTVAVVPEPVVATALMVDAMAAAITNERGALLVAGSVVERPTESAEVTGSSGSSRSPMPGQ
jgi:hypothetical protein